jgi:vancomycin permeability regulator SanA
MKESWELAEDFWKVNVMNEKIKQLALQATSLANDQPYTGTHWDTLFQEKFAELIVEECVGILEPKSRYMGEGPEVLKDKIRQIKKHFGVEL